MKLNAFCIIVFLLGFSCSLPEPHGFNPPADGFDLANSDPAAVELADSIMAAAGGWQNWNNTRFISWKNEHENIFLWDKKKGRVRIELPSENTIHLIDLKSQELKVQRNGKELSVSDSLQKQVSRLWRNEAYSLVIPFQLKDNGITLKYLGEDILPGGTRCNVLEVLMKRPETPGLARSLMYVDLRDNRIKQWVFFNTLKQEVPTFIQTFDNYAKYGTIYLSADRTDGSGPKEVKIYEQLPERIFTQF